MYWREICPFALWASTSCTCCGLAKEPIKKIGLNFQTTTIFFSFSSPSIVGVHLLKHDESTSSTLNLVNNSNQKIQVLLLHPKIKLLQHLQIFFLSSLLFSSPSFTSLFNKIPAADENYSSFIHWRLQSTSKNESRNFNLSTFKKCRVKIIGYLYIQNNRPAKKAYIRKILQNHLSTNLTLWYSTYTKYTSQGKSLTLKHF